MARRWSRGTVKLPSLSWLIVISLGRKTGKTSRLSCFPRPKWISTFDARGALRESSNCEFPARYECGFRALSRACQPERHGLVRIGALHGSVPERHHARRDQEG